MQDTDLRRRPRSTDPDNRLLGAAARAAGGRGLRDAVLSVSGTLNPEFGPAYKPPIPPEAMLARNTKDPYPKDAARHGVDPRLHRLHVPQAGRPAPADAGVRRPDAAVSCGRRNVTTVAPQRLALLNDLFLRPRGRSRAAAPGRGRRDARGWVSRGFELASRGLPATPKRAASVRFLEEQLRRRSARRSLGDGRAPAARPHRFRPVLFSLNEFIYVD